VGWLGVFFGTLITIIVAPGVLLFPLVYWLIQGVFPVFYFELLGISLSSNLIGATLWALSTSD
jgi:hypothetical protein